MDQNHWCGCTGRVGEASNNRYEIGKTYYSARAAAANVALFLRVSGSYVLSCTNFKWMFVPNVVILSFTSHCTPAQTCSYNGNEMQSEEVGHW